MLPIVGSWQGTRSYSLSIRLACGVVPAIETVIGPEVDFLLDGQFNFLLFLKKFFSSGTRRGAIARVAQL